MYKQYLKQALVLLKESPLFSLITVLGTAAAICMIMVMVIIFEIQNKNIEPEVSRDRTLYMRQMTVKEKQTGEVILYTSISAPVAKMCLLTLQIPEAISLQDARTQTLVTTTDRSQRMKSDLIHATAGFWKLFSFHFLAGKPFEQSDVASNRLRAVISRQLALRMFGEVGEQIIGQTLLVANRPYVVSGVVEDVSPLADHAYAQIWTPYAQTELDQLMNEVSYDGLYGNATVLFKARSTGDFDAIREELNQSLRQLNQNLTTCEVSFMEQPDTQIENRLRIWSDVEPDVSRMISQYAILLTILLLVPAMNLSGLTTSRMQRRIGEIGVRKAFGATRGTLISQVLVENFVVTLLGGVVGLLLSYISVFMLKDWLLGSSELAMINSDLTLSAGMLIRPAIFCFAFFFCLLLNLMSAAIPAWNATGGPIVDSLNEK